MINHTAHPTLPYTLTDRLFLISLFRLNQLCMPCCSLELFQQAACRLSFLMDSGSILDKLIDTNFGNIVDDSVGPAVEHTLHDSLIGGLIVGVTPVKGHDLLHHRLHLRRHQRLSQSLH